jgi:hypothetical protein
MKNGTIPQQHDDLYLDILFPEAVKPEDIEIVTPATWDTPGLVRIGKAFLKENPQNTATKFLMSWVGGDQKIGAVIPLEMVDAPFESVYRIDPLSLKKPDK